MYTFSPMTHLYISADAGDTFTSSQFLPSGSIPPTMRTGTVFGSTIYLAGDMGSVYKSTDNGASWQSPTKIANFDYVQDLYADDSGKIIAVGTPSVPSAGQQVIVSDDGGKIGRPFLYLTPMPTSDPSRCSIRKTGFQ